MGCGCQIILRGMLLQPNLKKNVIPSRTLRGGVLLGDKMIFHLGRCLDRGRILFLLSDRGRGFPRRRAYTPHALQS